MKLLKPEEVAALLRVDRSWVYRAAREGKLPHVKLGHYVRFEEAGLHAWLREQAAASVNGNEKCPRDGRTSGGVTGRVSPDA
jgi:excisionase family DNA binding protein